MHALMADKEALEQERHARQQRQSQAKQRKQAEKGPFAACDWIGVNVTCRGCAGRRRSPEARQGDHGAAIELFSLC